MIYFVRSHVTGHIKIGYTGALKKRFRGLKTQYGELDILGIMDGEMKDERELHSQFAHLNVGDLKYGLEWFLETQELIDYINQFTREYSELTQNVKPKLTPLELTLGQSKAQILTALKTPLNTGELAVKLVLTAGSVSQQLKNLERAGLVECKRNGKNVYYKLTLQGQKLIDLFEPKAKTK